MNSGLLLFVLLSCSQPGIIIAFSQKIMQEYIGKAAESTIKYYGQPAINQSVEISKFWTKLKFTHLKEYFSPFIDSSKIQITPSFISSLNVQIPLEMGANDTVEITRYYIFKSSPSNTHMSLAYPGLFLNVDFNLGLKNGGPVIKLGNLCLKYYFEEKSSFSFSKKTSRNDEPYTGAIKSLAFQAFQGLFKSQLTELQIDNIFELVLSYYTTQTNYRVSSEIQADYSYLEPYDFDFDSNFWVGKINGTLYTPGAKASQFSTNLPHFDSSKNYSYQIFISQQLLQQGVDLMPLQVNISRRFIDYKQQGVDSNARGNYTRNYIYTMNCSASNPSIIVGGTHIKLVYKGECSIDTSRYMLNLKFNGAYNFTPGFAKNGVFGLGFELSHAFAQYNDQVVDIIEGNGEYFAEDKEGIYSLVEEQIIHMLYSESLPFPKIRCINNVEMGEIIVKNGYVEVLMDLALNNKCFTIQST